MLIIFNPTAGRRRAQYLWRVLDVLAGSGVYLQVAGTTRAGHAESLARSAAEAGVSLVVAAGGDGTIAEVANGLIGSQSKLGVIPLGTANVLAHELSLPFAPEAVAAALVFGRTRPHWPGIVQSGDRSRLFVQMLGIGFDAQVVHRLSPRLKRACGRSAYLMQTARELIRYDFSPIRLRIDNTEMEAGSVIVTKGRLYAGTYVLEPDARPGEPGLSIVLFEKAGPLSALAYGAALPLNMLPRAPGLRRLRVSRVEIIGNDRRPAQADGDAAGFAPMVVTDAAGPIQIVTG